MGTKTKKTASEPNLLKMRYKPRGAVERRNCSPLVARRRGGHHAGPAPAHHLPPPPPPLHHHHQHHQAPPPAHSSSVVMAAKRMSQLTSNRLLTRILTANLVSNSFALFLHSIFFLVIPSPFSLVLNGSFVFFLFFFSFDYITLI